MFVTIHDLQKYYGEGANRHPVLNHITAGMEAGRICVIMGSSGSGKSTLLNCIGGLERIDGGSVCVDGLELAGLSAKKLAAYRRANLGFVFQFYNLIPGLTVAENVDVCRYLSPNPLNRDDLLEMLGLGRKKNAFPNTLSGGEQQRCAIARALVKNPKLLLCDEPTGALNSRTARAILCLLDYVNETLGTTILMVTHNGAIQQMAHQIITIHDGEIRGNFLNPYRVPAAQLGDIG